MGSTSTNLSPCLRHQPHALATWVLHAAPRGTQTKQTIAETRVITSFLARADEIRELLDEEERTLVGRLTASTFYLVGSRMPTSRKTSSMVFRFAMARSIISL